MFTDVGELLVTYIGTGVSPVHVGSRVPTDRPTRFVQIRRVGGTAALPVRDRARFDVFTWDETDPGAMALALEVRELIWALAGNDELGVTVYRVAEFMGPRHFDDDITGTPRVWQTLELTVRADDVIHLANPTGS